MAQISHHTMVYVGHPAGLDGFVGCIVLTLFEELIDQHPYPYLLNTVGPMCEYKMNITSIIHVGNITKLDLRNITFSDLFLIFVLEIGRTNKLISNITIIYITLQINLDI